MRKFIYPALFFIFLSLRAFSVSAFTAELDGKNYFSEYINENANEETCLNIWTFFKESFDDAYLNKKLLSKCPDLIDKQVSYLLSKVDGAPSNHKLLAALTGAYLKTQNCPRALFYYSQFKKFKKDLNSEDKWLIYDCLTPRRQKKLMKEDGNFYLVWKHFNPKLHLDILNSFLKDGLVVAYSALFSVSYAGLKPALKRRLRKLRKVYYPSFKKLKYAENNRVKEFDFKGVANLEEYCETLRNNPADYGRAIFREQWFKVAFAGTVKLRDCRAQIRQALFDYKNAEKELVKIYYQEKENLLVLKKLAKLRFRLGKYRKSYLALELYQKNGGALDEREYREFFLYGVLANLGLEKSQENLMNATKFFPNSEWDEERAILFYKSKNWNALKKQLEKLPSGPIKSWLAYTILFETGKKAEAADLLVKISRLFPDNPILTKGPKWK